MGVAIKFLLKLCNHKLRRSDFHVVYKPNKEACRWYYQRINCLGHKEETCILVSVVKLLGLSIFPLHTLTKTLGTGIGKNELTVWS